MFVFTGVSIRYILFSVFADSRYLKCIEISILSIENTESSISISSGYWKIFSIDIFFLKHIYIHLESGIWKYQAAKTYGMYVKINTN